MANKNLRVNMQIETSIKAQEAELKKLSDEINRYLGDFDFGIAGNKQLQEMKRSAQEIQKILNSKKQGDVISEKETKKIQDASNSFASLAKKFNDFKNSVNANGIENYSKKVIDAVNKIDKQIEKTKENFSKMTNGADFDKEVQNVDKLVNKIDELNQKIEHNKSIDIKGTASKARELARQRKEKLEKENAAIKKANDEMDAQDERIKRNYVKKTTEGNFNSIQEAKDYIRDYRTKNNKKEELQKEKNRLEKAIKKGDNDDVTVKNLKKTTKELQNINEELAKMANKAELAKNITNEKVTNNTKEEIKAAREAYMRENMPQYASQAAMNARSTNNKTKINNYNQELVEGVYEQHLQSQINLEQTKLEQEKQIAQERVDIIKSSTEEINKYQLERAKIAEQVRNQEKKFVIDENAIDSTNESLKEGISYANDYASSFGKITDRLQMVFSVGWIFDKTIQILRESFDMVKSMDKDLTQIGLVLGKTSGEVWKNFDTYNKMADRLSTTTSDVTAAMKLFYQQGLNTAEVNKMVEASAVAAALGETSMAEASETLTSIVNSYGLTANDAMNVTDKISAIAIKSAADFGEMSTAIEKVASSAATAGLDLDHMMGYLAKMINNTKQAA